MNDRDSAFPVRRRWDSGNEGYDLQDSGLTAKQYAAIKLKVPRSGDPDIDAMIRENRRDEFAKNAIDTAFCQCSALGEKNPSVGETAATAYKIADAMLAELEKEVKG
jgi:hypothetical protein